MASYISVHIEVYSDKFPRHSPDRPEKVEYPHIFNPLGHR